MFPMELLTSSSAVELFLYESMFYLSCAGGRTCSHTCVHVRAGDTMHSPTNGAAHFSWSTSGGNMPRYGAMHQQRQGGERLLTSKHECQYNFCLFTRKPHRAPLIGTKETTKSKPRSEVHWSTVCEQGCPHSIQFSLLSFCQLPLMSLKKAFSTGLAFQSWLLTCLV